MVEAKERLSELQMTDEERSRYKLFVKRLHDIASQRFTEEVDFAELLKKREEKGIEKGIEKVALELLKAKVSDQTILSTTGVSIEQLDYLKGKIDEK